jgi:hypothetical protein
LSCSKGASLVRRPAVDLTLDRKQRIDALDRLDRDQPLPQLGQFKEFPPRMRPARCLSGGADHAPWFIQLREAGIGIRLQDPAVVLQERLRMLTLAVGRVEIHGCRPVGSGEGTVIAQHGIGRHVKLD